MARTASLLSAVVKAAKVRRISSVRCAWSSGGRPTRPTSRFVCWAAMKDNLSFVLPLQAALPLFPEPPPQQEAGAPGPFAFADDGRVRDILVRAGYVDVEVVRHDTALVVAGGSLERAVELSVTLGPLSRALATAPVAIHAQVRAAVRDALAPHLTPAGVSLPASTWIATASAP